MTLYLLNYKNYYNRSAKVHSELINYEDYIVDAVYDFDFNSNDGIWSSVIVNSQYTNIDYLIVYDKDNGEIVSRWYILESTRKRAEQYQLKLLRDVIADYRDIVINSPCFVEKATVSYGNPLLFNSEAMTFNQIKTSEMPIRDNTGCPWIVGYINKEVGSTQISAPTKDAYYEEYASLDEIPFYTATQAGGLRYGKPIDYSVRIGYRGTTITGGGEQWYCVFDDAGLVRQDSEQFADWSALAPTGEYSARPSTAYSAVSAQGSAYLRSTLASFRSNVRSLFNLVEDSTLNEFLTTYTTEGKIIKVGNIFYKVYRNNGRTQSVKYQLEADDTDMYNYLVDVVDHISALRKTKTDIRRCLGVNYKLTTYKLFLKEVSLVNQYATTIPTTRNHLNDAPYDMFAIPYNIDSRFIVVKNGQYDVQNCDAEAGMAIASKITESLGDRLYDLQLLPYCPIRNLLFDPTVNVPSLGAAYTNNATVDTDYSYITKTTGSTTTNVSVIFWGQRSDFSFDIIHTYTPDPTTLYIQPDYFDLSVNEADAKVQALCDMHRLVSPNYNGQFEFNIVKNDGVSYFTVDCTYKPYSPYIRVAPNFGGLYGQDFDDARGLICGGDFSLPTTTDQWKQYELNNKNYLNAFNRQIENMEVQNKYQRQSEILNAVTGAASAGVTGGITGAMLGGPTGAVVGATAGTVLSGVGGVVDVSINDKLRTEALDYTKDQFGYTLGNIKALPYSLNRVSSFNINNKIFPILEYYTCTDIEKQALRDKIKYNGMTIETIGTIAQYILPEESYIKGRLIRLPELTDDYHMAVAIAEEIYKGVFI